MRQDGRESRAEWLFKALVIAKLKGKQRQIGLDVSAKS
jgi:hypothetical protein